MCWDCKSEFEFKTKTDEKKSQPNLKIFKWKIRFWIFLYVSGKSTCFSYASQYSSESPEHKTQITLSKKAKFCSEQGVRGNILQAALVKTRGFLVTWSQERCEKELRAVDIFYNHITQEEMIEFFWNAENIWEMSSQ